MGSYIYNLTTNNITATSLINACGVRVHFSEYAYKISLSWSNNNKQDNARYCLPRGRAFDRRGWNDNYYVDGPKNKTELLEESNLNAQKVVYDDPEGIYNTGNTVADDVWGKRVPDSIAMLRYCVPVYKTNDSCYCDDADRKIVGFLVPRYRTGSVMTVTAPTIRTEWMFVPARTDAEIALRDSGVSIDDDFEVMATAKERDISTMYAIRNGGFLYFVGGTQGAHDLLLSETDNERANAHWKGYTSVGQKDRVWMWGRRTMINLDSAASATC